MEKLREAERARDKALTRLEHLDEIIDLDELKEKRDVLLSAEGDLSPEQQAEVRDLDVQIGNLTKTLEEVGIDVRK